VYKRQILKVLPLIALIITVTSCKKEDSKTHLLTSAKWKLSGYEFIPGLTIAGHYYTDYYGPYVANDCIYDDIIEFTDDGKIVTTEGGMVCDASMPSNKTEGSWYFNDDKSYLYVTVDYHVNIFNYGLIANELQVVELTKDKLICDGVFANDTTVKYRYTFTAQ
jgi:hypothetical protein